MGIHRACKTWPPTPFRGSAAACPSTRRRAASAPSTARRRSVSAHNACAYTSCVLNYIGTEFIYIGGALALLLVLVLVVGAVLFRQWRYERHLMNNDWKVERKDVIVKSASGNIAGASAKSLQSVQSVGSRASSARSQIFLNDYQENILKEELKSKQANRRGVRQAFADADEGK